MNSIKKGPILISVLADEINRAPASAVGIIRSHAGKQVTIGDTTLNWTDLS
jgi:MoxR-like ATPase